METFFGYTQKTFKFNNMDAIVVFADEQNRTSKWVLKTEYFDAFPNTQVELLKKGINLAYISNETRWCKDSDLDTKKEFCEFLHKEYGFKKSCAIIGMSCGGLIGTKFAAKYPEYVSVLYLDAPVLNLLSCPAGLGAAKSIMWEEFTQAMNITLPQLLSYRENPIDKMDVLIKNNIPVFMVAGDADDIVPYDENGEILVDYYKKHNGILEVEVKPGCSHHPHGLENPEKVVDFILKYI